MKSRESFPVTSGSGSQCGGPSQTLGKLVKRLFHGWLLGNFVLQLVCASLS